GAMAFREGSNRRAARQERPVEMLGELRVAIEQRLNPEPAKDAERRLLRQRGEPHQRRIELRGRRRQIHRWTVEALERLPAGPPSRKNRTDVVEERTPNEQISHPP